MIKLAMLLVGARALRRRWAVLVTLGLFWMMFGLAIMIDASDGFSVVTTEAFAILLLFEGLIALSGFTLAPRRAGRLVLFKALVLILLAFMILDFPIRVDLENSLLFGLAFLTDGAVRIATAIVVRFPGWQTIVAGGALEVGLGAVALSNWPISHHQTVPFCIGVALLLSGWTAVRLGLMLRRLTDHMPVLSLPVFDRRGWYHGAVAPPAVTASASRRHATPLVVHVWTPVGSAENPERRLLVDRYIAAVDGHGVISTGHSALELAPDIYISHYPAHEVEHSPEEFRRLLRASPENDVPGLFQPSYAVESAGWCPADAQVAFHVYDPAKLRAHWTAYRQVDTYNLTNRNCSVTVAVALEAALEGALGRRAVWRRFFGLMVNPDLWIAGVLRARAEAATWTPGLVLDYARTLHAIVEPQRLPWRRRLQLTVRHRRRRPGGTSRRPA